MIYSQFNNKINRPSSYFNIVFDADPHLSDPGLG